MRRLWRDYGLSIVLAALWLVSWAVQTYSGWVEYSNEEAQRGSTAQVGQYLWIWLRATSENWQSEWLQVLTFVVLSSCLLHRGSPQSKDGDEEQREMLCAILARLDRLENKSHG